MSEEIGIPNVPAIVWAAERERAQKRIAAGLCPNCGQPIVEGEDYEYCPSCEED